MLSRMSSKADEKVHVAIRCRPVNQFERSSRYKRVVDTSPKDKEVHVLCNNSQGSYSSNYQSRTYKFDKIFGAQSKQIDVYRSIVEPHIDEVLAGYNCTVLAYGQTGTGKTFTMEGERSGNEYTWENDPKAGIIPRTLSQLFDRLEKESSDFSIHVSLLEIYNEVIYDLLSPTEKPAKRKIFDDSNRKGSVIVSDQTEVRVLSKAAVYEILEQGAAKRRTEATLMNEFSSRSHSVFTITVHSKELTKHAYEEEELVKIGKLHLVDLAGSENVGRSGAVEQRAREAGNINQSLLTLGRCITALVDHAPHVPFRESKLTRLLQDSLGGATKTSIIATISPCIDNLEETLSTLEYASRAKNIQNKPKVNQKLTKKVLIKQYDNEIERLRRELTATRDKNGVYMDLKQYEEMHHTLEEMEATLHVRQEELEKYKTMFTSVTEQFCKKSEEYAAIQEALLEVREELSKQCYLSKLKGRYGVKVVEDANQVVVAANEMDQNLEIIHEKVDSLKHAENKNQRSAGCLHDKIQNVVGSMKETVQRLSEENTHALSGTLDYLGRICNEHEKEIDCLNGNIQKWSGIITENVQKFSETMESVKKATKNRLQYQKEVFAVKEVEMDDAIEKFKQDCLARQDAVIRNTHNIANITNLIVSVVKEQMKLQQSAFQVCGHLMTDGLDKLVENFKKMKKDQEKDLTISMSTAEMMLDTLKNEIICIKAKQLEHVSSTNVAVLSEVESMKTSLEKTQTDFAQSRELTEQKAETLLQQCNQEVQMINQLETEDLNSTVAFSKSQQSLVSNCSQTLHEGYLEVEQMWSDGEAVTRRNVEENKASIKSFAKETNEKLADSKASLSESLGLVGDSLLKVSNVQSEFDGCVSHGLNSISIETENFYKTDFIHVQTTGKTPVRRDYKYPKSFPLLPPDSELLKSFEENITGEENQPTDDHFSDDNRENISNENDSITCQGDSATVILNESITIPDGGGIPFFKTTKKDHRNDVHSRLPLRATQNID